MEESIKSQLHSLYQTYSAINTQFSRIEKETLRLELERQVISDVLQTTRELEKELINNLEELLEKKLTPNDILEIIQSYEQGDN